MHIVHWHAVSAAQPALDGSQVAYESKFLLRRCKSWQIVTHICTTGSGENMEEVGEGWNTEASVEVLNSNIESTFWSKL